MGKQKKVNIDGKDRVKKDEVAQSAGRRTGR